jgi:hypothetical protein
LRPSVHPKPDKRLRERRDAKFIHGIVFVAQYEHADAPHTVALLRARREGPCRRRAAEPSDKFAPSKANPHLASRAIKFYRGIKTLSNKINALACPTSPTVARNRKGLRGAYPTFCCGQGAIFASYPHPA